MITVDIRSANKVDNYYVYNVEIVIDRTGGTNVFKCNRRYSDFIELKKNLEEETHKPVPYQLPSKLTFLKKPEEVVQERKEGLAEFTRRIINDPQYQRNPTLLTFYSIPRSTFMELTSDSLDMKKNRMVNEPEHIDSLNKWLDSVRDTKSLLQDVRTKMFSQGNIVDCRAELNVCRKRISALDAYLNAGHGLGAGELARRRQMLDSLKQEYEELDSLVTGFVSKGSQTAQRPSAASASDTDRGELFHSTRSGRTLGKAQETEVTRTMDNQALYQNQQVLMDKQDQDLDSLHRTILQQRQLGLDINEELDQQNDMLKELNNHVDESSDKMEHARKRVGKIL